MQNHRILKLSTDSSSAIPLAWKSYSFIAYCYLFEWIIRVIQLLFFLIDPMIHFLSISSTS
jgi:hypothetical protein